MSPDTNLRASIIITTKNNPSTLEHTVDGCFALELSNGRFDLFIYDDASDQLQLEALDRIEKKHRARIENNTLTIQRGTEGIGASSGRNKISVHAKGEVLAIIDGDAYPQMDWLEKALQPFTDPTVGVVASRVVFDGDHEVVNGMGGTLSRHGFGIDHYLFQPVQNIPTHSNDALFAMGCGMLIRRKTWDELGGFDDLIKWGYEDTDFSMRAWTKGYRTVTQPAAIVYHDTCSFGSPSRFRAFIYMRHRWLFMLKHWPALWVFKTFIYEIHSILCSEYGRVHAPIFAKVMLSLIPNLPALIKARRNKPSTELLEKLVSSSFLAPPIYYDHRVLQHAPLTPVRKIDWNNAETFQLLGGFMEHGQPYISIIENGRLDLALFSTSTSISIETESDTQIRISPSFLLKDGKKEIAEPITVEQNTLNALTIPARAIRCRLTFTGSEEQTAPDLPPKIIRLKEIVQQ